MKICATAASLVLLLATFARAQNSQFLFDPNGNLTVQMADTLFPPRILGQPQNQTPATNESAAFSVVVADPRALTYQWRFNGANIGGANGVSLLLDNVSTNNEGEYRVVLTNPSGSVTSAPAFLMIDNDGDGLGDSWELTYFGNLNQNATGDFDGDRISNLREFLDGSDPTDPNSARYRLLVIREGGSVVKSPDRPSYNKGDTVTLTVTASSNETFHAWLGDVVTRSNPVTLVMTNDKTVYARFTPITFTWTSLASGDWETATNWTPNLAPGLNDIALITSGVTVTLNTPADCADVTLGGLGSPTLTGGGTLIVRGNLFWTAGTMSGSGRTVLETNANLNLNSSSSVTLNPRTLENGGTILWSGGTLGVLGGAVITNRPGALFRVENQDGLLGGLAVGRFDNAGVFRKTTGSGTLTVGSAFNNFGTVEIQAGTLNLLANGTSSGNLELSAGAALTFSSGTHTWTGSSSIAGAGHLTFSGGTAIFAGLVNVSGSNTFSGGTANLTGNYICTNNAMTVSGGTVNLTGSHFCTNNTITVSSGVLNFSGTGLVSPAVVNLINGTLDGSANVTVGNVMNWTGGTMSGSGKTIIPAGVTLTVPNQFGVGLNTRTLENGGTVLWTGAGNIGLVSAVITNRPGALFLAQNAAPISFAFGACRFDNAGTFRKSVNSGTTAVANGVSFNNSGTVDIQTGTLDLGGGGAHSGGFAVPGGAALTFSGGGHSTDGSSSITGAGQLTVSGGAATLAGLVNVTGSNTFSGGTANLNGNYFSTNNTMTISGNPSTTVNLSGTGLVSPAVLNLTDGTLTGTSTVTVKSAMNWTGGRMSGSGRTIIAAAATLNVAFSSVPILDARTLENGGTILGTGAGIFGVISGAVITNRPGALFHVQNAAGIGGGIANGRLDNAGTFRKSISTGTTTVDTGLSFNNSGTVDIRSGILAANGGYTSTANALLNCALGGTTPGTGYGQLQVAGTVTLNGALSVDLLPGFPPATNDAFTVVTAGTRSGTFASFSYPSSQVTMQLSNTASSVIVRVTGIVPPPVLHIASISPTTARLYWATNHADFHLEYNTALGTTNWAASLKTPVVTGTNFVVTNSLFAAQKYYRLSRIPAPFTPAPPMLTIQRASPVNVRLQWSTDDERPFSLQANTNLATSLWVSVTPAPTVAGTSYVVTNTISGTQKFYRLASP